MGNSTAKEQEPRTDLEVPSKPGSPRVIPRDGKVENQWVYLNQSCDCVIVTWNAPNDDGGSPITNYLLERRLLLTTPTSKTQWIRAYADPFPETQVALLDLVPGHIYEFRVKAQNVIGFSIVSRTSEPFTVPYDPDLACEPNFLEPLRDATALEHERVEFRVEIRGVPPPQVTWYKDGIEVQDSPTAEIWIQEDGQCGLVFFNAHLRDSGELKCVASNALGRAIGTALLTVESPPRAFIPKQYEEGLIFETGDTIRLKVGISGRPFPEVTWYHEALKLDPGGRWEIETGNQFSTLKVLSATRKDRGEYSLRLLSGLGEDTGSMLVTVTNCPTPPGRPRVTEFVGNSVVLEWDPPEDDGGCKIGSYVVEYFRMGWNVWLKATACRQLSAKLGDLIPGSTYKFRIKAENPYGMSESSPESIPVILSDSAHTGNSWPTMPVESGSVLDTDDTTVDSSILPLDSVDATDPDTSAEMMLLLMPHKSTLLQEDSFKETEDGEEGAESEARASLPLQTQSAPDLRSTCYTSSDVRKARKTVSCHDVRGEQFRCSKEDKILLSIEENSVSGDLLSGIGSTSGDSLSKEVSLDVAEDIDIDLDTAQSECLPQIPSRGFWLPKSPARIFVHEAFVSSALNSFLESRNSYSSYAPEDIAPPLTFSEPLVEGGKCGGQPTVLEMDSGVFEALAKDKDATVEEREPCSELPANSPTVKEELTEEISTAGDYESPLILATSPVALLSTPFYSIASDNEAASDCPKTSPPLTLILEEERELIEDSKSISEMEDVPDTTDLPFFVRALADQSVKVGTRARLLTEIKSSSKVQLNWRLNDKPVVDDSTHRLLQEGTFFGVDIAPVFTGDEGVWTCEAINFSGSTSSSASLRVIVPKSYKAPEFVEELRALLTEEGTVSLECKVVGIPTPVLKWFKDGQEIKAGDVFALTARADDPTSLGVYTCEAINCVGKAISSSKVHVLGCASRENSSKPLSPPETPASTIPPPMIIEDLFDQKVKVGETLRLAIRVADPPGTQMVQWFNKDEVKDPCDKYHYVDEGEGLYSLEISPLEIEDEGEWKCIALNDGGQAASTCFITLLVPKNYRPPRFLENLKAILTEEGLVSFECKVVGFPTPQLQWFKDGQELKPGDVYQLSGTNSLGSYSCIARNCMGQASSSAELTVEDIQNQLNEDEKRQLLETNQPPIFLQGLRSTEAKIGDLHQFTVQVTVTPEPTVTWYRDDELIETNEKYRILKEDPGIFSLEMSTLSFVDQADWKCIAVNDFGHSVTSCSLKLSIPRHYKKPYFLEALQAVLSEEGTVNLECKVIGVPQPTLKWFKDGVELKPGDIHRIISGQDGTCCLGTYTCEAHNCMGLTSSSAALLGFEERVASEQYEPMEHPAFEPIRIARQPSLSTIQEERSSQYSLYETAAADNTFTEISVSIDGKEMSLSLYETPDLTEEEAQRVVELFAEEISEHYSARHVLEFPPLRFTRESATTGCFLVEAIVIDVPLDMIQDEEVHTISDYHNDLETEADIEELSAMEALMIDEQGRPEHYCLEDLEIPQLPTDFEIRKSLTRLHEALGYEEAKDFAYGLGLIREKTPVTEIAQEEVSQSFELGELLVQEPPQIDSAAPTLSSSSTPSLSSHLDEYVSAMGDAKSLEVAAGLYRESGPTSDSLSTLSDDTVLSADIAISKQSALEPIRGFVQEGVDQADTLPSASIQSPIMAIERDGSILGSVAVFQPDIKDKLQSREDRKREVRSENTIFVQGTTQASIDEGDDDLSYFTKERMLTMGKSMSMKESMEEPLSPDLKFEGDSTIWANQVVEEIPTQEVSKPVRTVEKAIKVHVDKVPLEHLPTTISAEILKEVLSTPQELSSETEIREASRATIVSQETIAELHRNASPVVLLNSNEETTNRATPQEYVAAQEIESIVKNLVTESTPESLTATIQSSNEVKAMEEIKGQVESGELLFSQKTNLVPEFTTEPATTTEILSSSKEIKDKTESDPEPAESHPEPAIIAENVPEIETAAVKEYVSEPPISITTQTSLLEEGCKEGKFLADDQEVRTASQNSSSSAAVAITQEIPHITESYVSIEPSSAVAIQANTEKVAQITSQEEPAILKLRTEESKACSVEEILRMPLEAEIGGSEITTHISSDPNGESCTPQTFEHSVESLLTPPVVSSVPELVDSSCQEISPPETLLTLVADKVTSTEPHQSESTIVIKEIEVKTVEAENLQIEDANIEEVDPFPSSSMTVTQAEPLSSSLCHELNIQSIPTLLKETDLPSEASPASLAHLHLSCAEAVEELETRTVESLHETSFEQPELQITNQQICPVAEAIHVVVHETQLASTVQSFASSDVSVVASNQVPLMVPGLDSKQVMEPCLWQNVKSLSFDDTPTEEQISVSLNSAHAALLAEKPLLQSPLPNLTDVSELSSQIAAPVLSLEAPLIHEEEKFENYEQISPITSVVMDEAKVSLPEIQGSVQVIETLPVSVALSVELEPRMAETQLNLEVQVLEGRVGIAEPVNIAVCEPVAIEDIESHSSVANLKDAVNLDAVSAEELLEQCQATAIEDDFEENFMTEADVSELHSAVEILSELKVAQPPICELEEEMGKNLEGCGVTAVTLLQESQESRNLEKEMPIIFQESLNVADVPNSEAVSDKSVDVDSYLAKDLNKPNKEALAQECQESSSKIKKSLPEALDSSEDLQHSQASKDSNTDITDAANLQISPQSVQELPQESLSKDQELSQEPQILVENLVSVEDAKVSTEDVQKLVDELSVATISVQGVSNETSKSFQGNQKSPEVPQESFETSAIGNVQGLQEINQVAAQETRVQAVESPDCLFAVAEQSQKFDESESVLQRTAEVNLAEQNAVMDQEMSQILEDASTLSSWNPPSIQSAVIQRPDSLEIVQKTSFTTDGEGLGKVEPLELVVKTARRSLPDLLDALHITETLKIEKEDQLGDEDAKKIEALSRRASVTQDPCTYVQIETAVLADSFQLTPLVIATPTEEKTGTSREVHSPSTPISVTETPSWLAVKPLGETELLLEVNAAESQVHEPQLALTQTEQEIMIASGLSLDPSEDFAMSCAQAVPPSPRHVASFGFQPETLLKEMAEQVEEVFKIEESQQQAKHAPELVEDQQDENKAQIEDDILEVECSKTEVNGKEVSEKSHKIDEVNTKKGKEELLVAEEEKQKEGTLLLESVTETVADLKAENKLESIQENRNEELHKREEADGSKTEVEKKELEATKQLRDLADSKKLETLKIEADELEKKKRIEDEEKRLIEEAECKIIEDLRTEMEARSRQEELLRFEELKKREEEERLRVELEERKRLEEEEANLRAAMEEKDRLFAETEKREIEDRLRKETEEKRLREKAEELERVQREEVSRKELEEKQQQDEEEKRRKDEEQRREEERLAKEAKIKKDMEEKQRQKEEETRLRIEEEKREEERLAKEAKIKQDLEEERLRLEAETHKHLEEERLKEENEKQRLIEEERVKAELEENHRQEKERLQKEAEEQKRQEEERIKAELEEDKRQEEQRLRKEAEERKRLKEERLKVELEAKKRQEEDRLRLEAEELTRLEEERLKKESEEKKRQEEERLRKETEEKKRLEEEQLKMELEEKKRQEEDRLMKKAEEKKQLEERLKVELEEKKRQEEDRLRKEAEEKKRLEEERLKQELEEKKRQEEEERLRKEAEERKRLEEERLKVELEEKKRQEEERLKKEAEGKKRLEKERIQAELDEKRRQEEEDRLRLKAEEQKRLEEERRNAELEEKNRREEERIRIEAEEQKRLEEERLKAERQEKERQEEEERLRKEAEKQKRIEEERVKAELEAKKRLKEEDERKKREAAEKERQEEERLKAQREKEERLQKEAEEKERLENERLKKENDEKLRKEEEKRLRKEAREKKRKEEERLQAEQKQREEEQEELRKKEAEKQRIEDERLKKEAEEKRLQEEAEEKRLQKEAEEKRLQEEARIREEERLKQEAELKKRQEEERLKKEAEEEQKRLENERIEAEKKRKAEEELEKQVEAKKRLEEEEERRKREEEERLKKEAEVKKRREERRLKKEAEEKKLKEEELRKAKEEELKKQKEEELRQQKEEELRKQKEEELQKQKEEEELKRKAEEKSRLKKEAELREEERIKLEAEAKARLEEEKLRKAKKSAIEVSKLSEDLQGDEKLSSKAKTDDTKVKRRKSTTSKKSSKSGEESSAESSLVPDLSETGDSSSAPKTRKDSVKKKTKPQNDDSEPQRSVSCTSSDEPNLSITLKTSQNSEESPIWVAQSVSVTPSVGTSKPEELQTRSSLESSESDRQKQMESTPDSLESSLSTRRRRRTPNLTIEDSIREESQESQEFEDVVRRRRLRKALSTEKSAERDTESTFTVPETRIEPESFKSRYMDQPVQMTSSREAFRREGTIYKGGLRDPKNKPKFSTKLRDMEAARGSNIKLTCSVLGSPEPHVEWYKNGFLFSGEETDKCRQSYDGDTGIAILELHNVLRADSGEYTCVAKNCNGRSTCSADLRIRGDLESKPIPPTFASSLRDSYDSGKDELVLDCVVRGFPQPKITWFKDGSKLHLSSRHRQFLDSSGKCKLVIYTPSMGDAGHYTCIADNRESKDEVSAFINVPEQAWARTHRPSSISEMCEEEDEAPQFRQALSDQKVHLGGSVTFHVDVSGIPTPEVSWLFNNTVLPPSSKIRHLTPQHGIQSFSIYNITASDLGTYTCRATNAVSTVQCEARLAFKDSSSYTNSSPAARISTAQPSVASFVEKPESFLDVARDQDLILECTVTGYPKPSLQWTKGSRDLALCPKTIIEEIEENVHRLTLKKTTYADSGTYCIQIRNCHGSQRAFCTVRVKEVYVTTGTPWELQGTANIIQDLEDKRARRFNKDVPGPIPSPPTATAIGKNFVSLSWSKPSTNGGAPIMAYKVEAWLIGEGANWTELAMSPIPSFDAYNLKPEREYLFRVTPRNKYGWGEPTTSTNPIKTGALVQTPRFTSALYPQMKVLQGSEVSLQCEVFGVPVPRVKWLKDGSDIDTAKQIRYSVKTEGTNQILDIYNISSEDDAKFVCEANNAGGTGCTSTRLLVVDDPRIVEADENFRKQLERLGKMDTGKILAPQFTMRPRDRRVQVTYPVRLTCQVVGFPKPDVTWKFNYKLIQPDERHTFCVDGDFHTLEISNTKFDDAGLYQVHAQNSQGAITCPCRLIVDGGIKAYIPPIFVHELEDRTVSVGHSISLVGRVEAYPAVGVTWYRDGVRLRPSRKYDMCLDRDGTVTLLVANAQIRDAGVYMCEVTNEMGKAETFARVTIKHKEGDDLNMDGADVDRSQGTSKAPKFLQKPRSTEVLEGDSLVILCEVVGDPKPEVIWLRDWLNPDYYHAADQFVREGDGPVYRLEIPCVKLDYTGAYSVIARNCHGEAKAVISLQVYAHGQGSKFGTPATSTKLGTLQKVPEISQSLRDLRCCDGDAVTFECRVCPQSESNIRWEKSGKLLRLLDDLVPSFDGECARLTIKRVYPEDEGEYTCVAYNELGRAGTSACLIVDVADDKENDLTVQLDTRPPGTLSTRTTPRTTPARSFRSQSPALPRQREGGESTTAQPRTRVRAVPPKFYSVPHNKIAEVGDTVRFQCSVAGHPSPKVKWDKDYITVRESERVSFEESDDVRVLEIKNVTPEDAGLYRVTVENELGRIQANARLEILNKTSYRHLGAVRSGSTGRSGSGSYIPSLRSYTRSSTTRNVGMSSRAGEIRGASTPRPRYCAKDAKELKNTVVSPEGPSFSQGLKHVTVHDGESFEFSVIVQGTPPLRVVWVRNDKVLKNNKDFEYKNRGPGQFSLLIRDVFREDAGIYVCEAYNAYGEADSWCQFKVEDPKEVLPNETMEKPTTPRPVVSKTESQICTAVNKTSASKREKPFVSALKSKPVLAFAGVNLIQRSSSFGSNSKTRPAPSVVEQSKLQRSSSLRSSRSILLRSNDPVTQSNDDIRTKKTNKFKLSRPSSLVKSSTTSKEEGKEIPRAQQCPAPEVEKEEPEPSLPLLTQPELTLRSGGFPEPDLLSLSADAELEPEVFLPYDEYSTPAEIVKGPVDISALRGTDIVLEALVIGRPEPVVRWLKGGKELRSNSRVGIRQVDGVVTLSISHITADDSGKYIIMVENEHGTDCHYASLAVEGPPDPPAGPPNVCEVQSDGVTLSWYGSVYDGGSMVTGYVVEMLSKPSDEWLVISDRCNSTSYVVQSLKTNGTYSFRIRAQNIHGLSVPSKESESVCLDQVLSDDEETGEDGKFMPPFAHRVTQIESDEDFKKRYSVQPDIIGKGRFGVVYRATELDTKAIRAAKFVRCIKSADREKVYQEIDVMNKLEHPKLLQLAAAFELPKEVIMVLEYIPGGELFERVVADDFTLTEKDCILFMRQIVDGVGYMHSKNIVHLDLKPENILCQSATSHQIKLIDFGLARELHQDVPVRVLFGTPEFIPPEIVSYEPISFASDMWAVGVVCYVLLSGLSPFMGDNDADTFANITLADFDFIDEAFNAISQDAKDFISALLVKRPEGRLTAENCLKHKWLAQTEKTMKDVKLSTDRLKKFIIRRKWHKTGNAIRALGRMASLSSSRRNSASSSHSPSRRSSRMDGSVCGDPLSPPHSPLHVRFPQNLESILNAEEKPAGDGQNLSTDLSTAVQVLTEFDNKSMHRVESGIEGGSQNSSRSVSRSTSSYSNRSDSGVSDCSNGLSIYSHRSNLLHDLEEEEGEVDRKVDGPTNGQVESSFINTENTKIKSLKKKKSQNSALAEELVTSKRSLAVGESQRRNLYR